MTTRRAKGDTVSLSWIHLSDLHFGHGRGVEPHIDRQQVLGRLLDDVALCRSELGSPDYVFATGDFAHAGKQSQLEEARSWLVELTRRLDLGLDRVFVVPGNHDVDRDLVGPNRIVKACHGEMRRDPETLSDMLESGDVEAAVWPKLRAYQSFSSRDFGSPEITPESPFWTCRLSAEPGAAHAVGLNSALQCYDDHDDEETHGVGPNLQLSRWQLAKALRGFPSNALLIALVHHPPELLRDGSELVTHLAERPHLLLCGHVHSQGAFAMLPLGQHGHLRMVAGAGHSVGGEGTHAYAWGFLSQGGLDYYPRQWSRRHGKFLGAPLDTSIDVVKSRERLGLHISYPRDALPGPLREWAGSTGPVAPPVSGAAYFEPLAFREPALTCATLRRAGDRLCDLVGRYQYDPDVVVAVNQGGLVVTAAMMKRWHNTRVAVGCVFCSKRPGRPYEIKLSSLPGRPDKNGRWKRIRPERILVVDTKLKSAGSAKATYEFLRRTCGDGVEIRFALVLAYAGWRGRWTVHSEVFPWPASLVADDDIRAYIAYYTDKEIDDIPEPIRPGWPDEP
jgi:predicted MPP superfamily phosphohydrolase